MTTDDRAARLAAIRERWAKATPGPWSARHRRIYDASMMIVGVTYSSFAIADDSAEPDADAIAHAPEDVAWLLAEVERLTPGEPGERNAEQIGAVDIDWMGDVCAFRCRCGHQDVLSALELEHGESATCPGCGRVYCYHMDAWLGVMEGR